MRLAIIGDMHLGFSYGTERREDSFTQAKEAIDTALEEKVDAIILMGDIFDTRVPSQDVLGKAMKIFLKPLTKPSNTKLSELIGKDKADINDFLFEGTPIIAINGNHDHRGKGLTNPVELLEKAGLLIRLNVSTIVLEKEGKIAIHGLSYIPERYVKEVLEKWNPQPIKGIQNIFLMHQNIGQYVYADDDTSILGLEDLPKGFDLIVNGHVHWSDQVNLHGKQFLLAGSTVSTQVRKIESDRPKGIWILENNQINFKPLTSARKIIHKTLTFKDFEPKQVIQQLEKELELIGNFKPKPLVRINLNGTLKKGFETTDLNVSALEHKFADKFILNIGKGKVLSKSGLSKEDLLSQFKKEQVPVEELGYNLLRKHLSASDYKHLDNSEELLNQLIDGNADTVYKFLKENYG